MAQADDLFGESHIEAYERTGGETGHMWRGATCLVLRTTGRRSGEERRFALIYGRDGDDLAIVASKGGAPEHPGWYLNLEAHPDVEVQVRDEVRTVRARTATPEEKERWWPIMLQQWPPYEEYQAKTDRDIPVVVLEPR